MTGGMTKSITRSAYILSSINDPHEMIGFSQKRPQFRREGGPAPTQCNGYGFQIQHSPVSGTHIAQRMVFVIYAN